MRQPCPCRARVRWSCHRPPGGAQGEPRHCGTPPSCVGSLPGRPGSWDRPPAGVPGRAPVCAGRPGRTTRTRSVTRGLRPGARLRGRRGVRYWPRRAGAAGGGRRGAGRGCGCGSAGTPSDAPRSPRSPAAPRSAPALRRHRRAAGLTQEALAERAGVGVRTLQGLEAGRGAPAAGHGPAPGRRAGAARGGAGAVPGRGRAAPAGRPGPRPRPRGAPPGPAAPGAAGARPRRGTCRRS